MSRRADRGFARAALIGAALAAALAIAQASGATPISYDTPEEVAALIAGPGKDVAEANCLGCHSADYITTQPRGAGFGRPFWQAEADKMVHAYGAPIDAKDMPAIVDYLSATYGGEAAR